jgi:hypothetical protein
MCPWIEAAEWIGYPTDTVRHMIPASFVHSGGLEQQRLYGCKGRLLFSHFGCESRLFLKHFGCEERLFFKHLFKSFGCEGKARLLFKHAGCEPRLLFKKLWMRSKAFVQKFG